MKICFWGGVASALKGNTSGGGELQIALLAKALATDGHDVVIIDPFSNESFVTDEGVKLISVPEFSKGYGAIRLFWYRLPALWKVFSENKSDYFYIRMRSYLHIIPYLVAKRNGIKFVQAIASDLDLLNANKKIRYSYSPRFNIFEYLTVCLPNDLVFNYILKKSNLILLQHSGQIPRNIPPKNKVFIFPNIIDMNNLPVREREQGEYYIYVGSLSILKGLDKLFELVILNEHKNTFVIVGEARDSRSKAILNDLSKIKNVIIKGRLNHKDTLQLIANSKALINTSYFEGFPNIFLEAWATGVPVISLVVNPGNVINKYMLGICCDADIEKMKSCIESNEIIHFDKDRLISYVKEFHNSATAGDRFVKILNNAN
jgi:glycosyltransferase involved in cell wall biosynthesis